MKFITSNYEDGCINFVKELDLPYDFIHYIEQELKSEQYSWIFYKEEEQYLAAHRSLIIDESVILRGIFVNQKIARFNLQITVLKYAMTYYSNIPYYSFLTFIDNQTIGKEFLMKKLGLKQIREGISRVSITSTNIPCYLKYNTIKQWREVENYEVSSLLSQSMYTIFNPKSWLKYLTSSQQYVYLHYYRDNNTLEIDEVITEEYSVNLVECCRILLNQLCDVPIQYVKVNINKELKISLLNIYMLKPIYVIPNVRVYKLDKD